MGEPDSGQEILKLDNSHESDKHRFTYRRQQEKAITEEGIVSS